MEMDRTNIREAIIGCFFSQTVEVENDLSSSRSRRRLSDCSESGCAVLKSLSREVSGVGIKLRKYRKKILKNLLVSRFRKHFNILRKGIKGKLPIQEQNRKISTLSCADMMSTMKKWRKFYKVPGFKRGWKFQTESQKVQLENLKPPRLCEVVAFHMNVEEKKGKMKTLSGAFGGDYKLHISEGKSSLLVSASSSSRDIEVELTCSICLDTLFDPVALKCGHIFCYMCACSAGSVLAIHGMKAANSTSKCPLCRKVRIKLVSLSSLSFPVSEVISYRLCPKTGYSFWDGRSIIYVTSIVGYG
ncbi:OLC1v1006227C2 [Oldenlandia corymbosa var. corymbosa]|uniref:OLC1v1006227C2 n=1 Tax=Oldenlandia corymbosa var. corymbosa TaxID=529605 RepID=A0AAV1DIL6_OLDCO|nr:OLC1v1006227C2 [Oldenlandia corymbosa var. corymbosa]